MDDNYRHELEALARLAQAEEAERQRVTAAALAEARQKLTDEYNDKQEALAREYYDKQLALTRQWEDEQNAKMDEEVAGGDGTEALERENARLLAVAEAARALKTAYFNATVGVEDYELELGELFNALKELE